MAESPMLTPKAIDAAWTADRYHDRPAGARAFLAAQDRASLTRKCRGLSIYLCNGCGGRWLLDPGLHHDARYTAPAFVACQGKVAERVYIDRDLLLGDA